MTCYDVHMYYLYCYFKIQVYCIPVILFLKFNFRFNFNLKFQKLNEVEWSCLVLTDFFMVL